MKDFTYVVYDDFDDNFDSLRAHACTWLTNMGLNETRWILDRAWFIYHGESMTFEEWINRK